MTVPKSVTRDIGSNKMPTTTFPKRHRINEQEARNISHGLLLFIKNKHLAEPTEKQWNQLGLAFNQGDPAADKVVAWITKQPEGKGYSIFEKALAQQGNNEATPEPIASFLSLAELDPDWLDRSRLQRGADIIARSGLTGMRVLRDFGLMAGYQASAINQTLIKTGSLEKGASRRIAETTKWWMDCTEPNGMEKYGKGYVSTLRVRIIHALVRHHVSNLDDWDSDYFGLPVNQTDMQATYLAFCVLFLLGQRLMGIWVTKDEAEDVMHLWRYIGWLMGVDETLLCESEQSGLIALYQNLLCQATADQSSIQLGQALMDEPLQRHYECVTPHWLTMLGWHKLHAHWDKAVHLSIVRLIVGRKGMQALGLPRHTLPWYPMICAPFNFFWLGIHRVIPGGLARLTRVNRQVQYNQLTLIFGKSNPELIAAKNVAASS